MMSTGTPFPTEIPSNTAQMVGGLLRQDSVCRLFGEHGHDLFDEAGLWSLYEQTGRPGINPVMLTMVLLLQFVERMPDRQAAEMVVMRMDWKYALRQDLTWGGFHYSDLCNMRKRLLASDGGQRLFDNLLVYLQAQGYLKAKGRQRVDSTHVLGAVRNLSRLELVLETLRLALEALLTADAPWVLAELPSSYLETYVSKRSDYRLGKDQVEQLMLEAGRDGHWLVQKVTPRPDLAALPEVVLLARVLEEQFEPDDTPPTDGVPRMPLRKRRDVDACGDVIATPHDPQARYGQKRQTGWLGYKLHVTEQLAQTGNFIVDVRVSAAQQHEATLLVETQQHLAAQHLTPAQLLADAAYISGANLAACAAAEIDLIGPPPHGSNKRMGFRLEDFTIDLDTRTATCPQGRTATAFNPSTRDDVAFHVRFGKQCQACPAFTQCTTEQRGRSLEISPHHALLTRQRQREHDPAFQRAYRARSGIEATISELVRAHGARRCRYRGLHKAQFQAFIAATALNLKRLATLTSALHPSMP
ncbi:IS1182 family transposase [bacterium]|nr:IS1182 family transposase [bacterium]